MDTPLPPRRRGRPPAVVAQPQTGETTTEQPKRRRRAKVGGHALKLHAPERPGFVRRWVNDDANRIADMEELGYSVVSGSGIETHSPGSVASRRVGTAASGSGLKAILMETPDELYAEGIAEREELHRQVDQAIVKGADPTGQMTSQDGSYGHGSIQVER